MNKKLCIVSIVLCCFFSALVHADAEAAVKTVGLVKEVPDEAEELRNAWILYAASGSDSALERYATIFTEFLQMESYSPEKQPYIVSEILFYTMFARAHCRSFSSSMDAPVTQMAAFINQSDDISPLSVFALRLFSFLAEKTRKYITINEVQVFEFPDVQMSNTKQNAEGSSITAELYRCFSAAEGMSQRLEKARIQYQSADAFKLTEDVFYKVLNDPSYLYVILYNGRYENLLDSFSRSCEAYLDLEEGEIRSVLADQAAAELSVFPQGMGSVVYSKTMEAQMNDEALLTYTISDLLYELYQTSMNYGYPVDIFFTGKDFAELLSINEEPFYGTCLPKSRLVPLCDSLVYACAAYLYVERVNKLMLALPSKGGM